jgi:hypothetical protein
VLFCCNLKCRLPKVLKNEVLLWKGKPRCVPIHEEMFLKQISLAASATAGAGLARMPLLHVAKPAKWAFAWHWAHVPGT